jgi:hypothetical protein
MRDDFLKVVQTREANSSIGASTLRGQPKGSIEITRNFLKKLDFNIFNNVNSESEFLGILDQQTDLLKEKIPSKSWGISRKALNIFLFHAINNIFLNKEYNLNKIIPFLELTLDNPNAKKLKELSGNKKIDFGWINITKLTKEPNSKIQDFAKKIAKEKYDCERCYLDLYFWRDGE